MSAGSGYTVFYKENCVFLKLNITGKVQEVRDKKV